MMKKKILRCMACVVPLLLMQAANAYQYHTFMTIHVYNYSNQTVNTLLDAASAGFSGDNLYKNLSAAPNGGTAMMPRTNFYHTNSADVDKYPNFCTDAYVPNSSTQQFAAIYTGLDFHSGMAGSTDSHIDEIDDESSVGPYTKPQPAQVVPYECYTASKFNDEDDDYQTFGVEAPLSTVPDVGEPWTNGTKGSVIPSYNHDVANGGLYSVGSYTLLSQYSSSNTGNTAHSGIIMVDFDYIVGDEVSSATMGKIVSYFCANPNGVLPSNEACNATIPSST